METQQVTFSIDGHRRNHAATLLELRGHLISAFESLPQDDIECLVESFNELACQSNSFHCVSCQHIEAFSNLSDDEEVPLLEGDEWA